jgi:serine/threonine protein kinase
MVTASPSGSFSPYVGQLSAAWRNGTISAVEQFFAEYPETRGDTELAVRLVYEEFCLRQEAGEEVTAEEMLQRFPEWRSKLQLVLDCHQLVLSAGAGPSAQAGPDFPSLGEQLGEFRLLTELGRGAEGRVFLATQPSLSDRPVVVKIVPNRGSEHLSLARLQHTSIVPLYFVQEHPEKHLRLLCMPYVGGLSLDHLLHSMADVRVSQRSGRHLVEALEAARETAPVALPIEGPALQFLPLATYAQAVCWIGACIADALQYAHGRGLMHLDLKPSNVLLAGIGQPMLLDFHLAHDSFPLQGADAYWLGGTPGYMSPEQESAIAAIREARPVLTAVDVRSDVYSLGLLLYELLGGVPPDPSMHPWRPELASLDSSLPPELLKIVTKCLAYEPRDRYAEAGELAAELRRCLVSSAPPDRPPATVPRQAGAARGQRGRIALAAVVFAAVCGGAGVFYWIAEQPAPLAGVTTDGWEERRNEGQRRIADDLHAMVDRLRFLDDLDSLPPRRLGTLSDGCREVWRQRSQVLDSVDPAQPACRQHRIRADLLDLAVLWSDLRIHVAKPEQVDQTRREVLLVLSEAEREFGSSIVLSQQRQRVAAALGLRDIARRAEEQMAALTPRNAWEHHAIGRSLLRSGEYDRAAKEFRQAVEHNPQDFWPNFYLGICAYRQSQFESALAAFSACVALRSDRAECYLNRGLAYEALGCRELAADDFATARRLDATLETSPRPVDEKRG